MSGRNFTERVRQTLAAARERAVALNHEYVGTEKEEARSLDHPLIGTEHLLLGLLAEGHGIAAQVLHQLGVRLDGGRQRVLAIVGGRGPTRVVVPDDVVHRGVREAVAPPRDELPTSIDVTLRYSNGAVVRRSFTNRGDTTKFLSSI